MKVYLLYDSGYNHGSYDMSEEFDVLVGVFTTMAKAVDARSEIIKEQYLLCNEAEDGTYTTYVPGTEESELDYDDWKYDVYVMEVDVDTRLDNKEEGA